MQLLALENASTTYILTGQLEYNVSNEDDKRRLYQIFVAYYIALYTLEDVFLIALEFIFVCCIKFIKR